MFGIQARNQASSLPGSVLNGRCDFPECALERGIPNPDFSWARVERTVYECVEGVLLVKEEESPGRENCFLKENIEQIKGYSPEAQKEKGRVGVSW